jgi:hypothetical protein
MADRIFLQPGTYAAGLETFPIQVGATTLVIPMAHANLEILGVGGAAATILDATGMAPNASGVIRFGPNAVGARLSGVTIRNYPGTLAAIRIGSSSAGLESHDIEIDRCVIENSACWGIATFGSSGALGPLKIHDNLIFGATLSCSADSSAIWISSTTGTGAGDVYNNTIVGGLSGFRIQGGLWNVFNNNVTDVTGCAFFDFCDPTAVPCASDVILGCGTPAAVLALDFNNTFNNGFNYFGITAGANDASLNPQYASPGTNDYHLQSTSPLVDTGTSALPGYVERDGDGDPRSLDGDSNFSALPDRGYDEVAKYGFVLQSGGIKQGATATFALTGPPGGLGLLFVSAAPLNFVHPVWGNVLVDFISPTFLQFATLVVGAGPLPVGPIPVNPAFNGVFLYTQALVLDLPLTGLGQFTNRIDNQL